jgi:FtsX-like permease family protein
VPAIVDSATAARAHGGLVELKLGQLGRIRLKVVATGARFPTTTGAYAVVDRVALARTLDDASPGTGTASEVWVAAPASRAAAVGAALKTAPFDTLAASVRADRQDALLTDPVAVGAGLLLLVAAGLGLLVAVVAVVLLVVAERRESAGELYALEADGMPPRDGRRLLLLRAVAVVAIGVPAGLVAGALLANWVARLVAVTAGGTTPVPPLRLALGPGALAVELAGALALALAAAALVAARSLREPLPVRPETDLR